MRQFLFPIITFSILILSACESNLPSSSKRTDGEAGPGVWVCLNQDTADNAVIKKIGLDGREMHTSPRCQHALDVALADDTGSVWTSQLGIDGNWHIIKYSDSGEELLRFGQRDAGFPFMAQSLASNPHDGSCWFVSLAQGQSHVCRLGPGGRLLADNTEFGLPVQAAAAADGGCWVLDEATLRVVRLDANGNTIFYRNLTGHIPRSLAVDPAGGDCWVGYDNILVKYDPAGELLLQMELENQINKIEVHPTNHIICIQLGMDLVDEYDGLGSFGWRFYTGGSITDIEFSENNGIWIANGDQHGIYKVSDAGVQEAAFPFAFAPAAVAIYETTDGD
jgi:hypothetical protein